MALRSGFVDKHNNKRMESCYSVEKELEKLLSKFSYIDKHTANSLQELLTYVDGVKRELTEGQLFSFLPCSVIADTGN